MSDFDDTETLARMNYLIDVARGNIPNKKFEDSEHREMYLREAEQCDYVVTLQDMKDIQSLLFR